MSRNLEKLKAVSTQAVIDVLTYKGLFEALPKVTGVKTVYNAVNSGKFPAKWRAIIKIELEKKGFCIDEQELDEILTLDEPIDASKKPAPAQ